MNSPLKFEKSDIDAVSHEPEQEIDYWELIVFCLRLGGWSAFCLPAILYCATGEKWVEQNFVTMALASGAMGFVVPLFVGLTQNTRDPFIGLLRGIASVVMFLMIGAIVMVMGAAILFKFAS